MVGVCGGYYSISKMDGTFTSNNKIVFINNFNAS